MPGAKCVRLSLKIGSVLRCPSDKLARPALPSTAGFLFGGFGQLVSKDLQLLCQLAQVGILDGHGSGLPGSADGQASILVNELRAIGVPEHAGQLWLSGDHRVATVSISVATVSRA